MLWSEVYVGTSKYDILDNFKQPRIRYSVLNSFTNGEKFVRQSLEEEPK